MVVIIVAVGALVYTVLRTKISSGLVHYMVGFGVGVPKETTVATVAGGGMTFLRLPRFLFSGTPGSPPVAGVEGFLSVKAFFATPGNLGRLRFLPSSSSPSSPSSSSLYLS